MPTIDPVPVVACPPVVVPDPTEPPVPPPSVVPPPPHEPPVVCETPIVRGRVLRRAAAGENSLQWGPFEIAATVTNGTEHIGWGATCGIHPDEKVDRKKPLVCKRQITMGQSLSSDACIHRLKWWLFEGMEKHDIVSRKDHVDISLRDAAPTLSEEELDAWADNLVAKLDSDAHAGAAGSSTDNE